jgi:hypothetical protein
MEERPVAGEPFSLATALGPVRSQLGGAYAHSALERECARVAAARVGTRNDTLNRAAYNLGTLVGSGLLDRSEVEVELTRAAGAAGLEQREIASTARSGLTAGIARPRRLVSASAAADGVHQLSLADAAETHRTLIPTLVPQTVDWPRVFGRHAQLGLAATAVRRELAAMIPGFELPAAPALEAEPIALGELLTELDEAYEAIAQASGPIVGSGRWQGILTLIDALRDLSDELLGAAESGGKLSPPAFTLVTSLSSAAARQIGTLAKEIATTLGAQGLRHSPLGNGLRRLQRDAEALAAFGAPVSPLTPSGYATGRGALQAQLGAMRRNLKSAPQSVAQPVPQSRPAAAA